MSAKELIIQVVRFLDATAPFALLPDAPAEQEQKENVKWQTYQQQEK